MTNGSVGGTPRQNNGSQVAGPSSWCFRAPAALPLTPASRNVLAERKLSGWQGLCQSHCARPEAKCWKLAAVFFGLGVLFRASSHEL